MSDLIIDKSGIVREDIVNQNNAYGEVSDRYNVISTGHILDIIKEVEPTYRVVGFNNSYVRNQDKDSFQKHAIMLEFPDSTLIDGTKMNMIIFNSYDRSMSLRILAGAIRAACNNGLVWGDEILPEKRIKHTNKNWEHSVYSLMNDFKESKNKTKDMIEEMENRYMSYGDMGRFAEQVAEELINPIISGKIVDPLEMLVAKRKEDVGKDLWRTFNKIQESLSMGGIHRVMEKDDVSVISKTHKITDERKRIELNKELHTMAMSYL